MVLALLDFLVAFSTTNYDIISDQLKDLGVVDMVLGGLFPQQLWVLQEKSLVLAPYNMSISVFGLSLFLFNIYVKVLVKLFESMGCGIINPSLLLARQELPCYWPRAWRLWRSGWGGTSSKLILPRWSGFGFLAFLGLDIIFDSLWGNCSLTGTQFKGPPEQNGFCSRSRWQLKVSRSLPHISCMSIVLFPE